MSISKLHSYLLGSRVRIGQRIFNKKQPAYWAEEFKDFRSLGEVMAQHSTGSLVVMEAINGTAVLLTPVVNIDPKAPDFLLWGRNCKVLGMKVEVAQDVLYGAEPEPTADQVELFWEGYSHSEVTM